MHEAYHIKHISNYLRLMGAFYFKIEETSITHLLTRITVHKQSLTMESLNINLFIQLLGINTNK